VKSLKARKITLKFYFDMHYTVTSPEGDTPTPQPIHSQKKGKCMFKCNMQEAKRTLTFWVFFMHFFDFFIHTSYKGITSFLKNISRKQLYYHAL
jgi:hypothetical protein